MDTEDDVEIRLSGSEALVLFEWLAEHGEDAKVSHEAERVVLWRVEAALESVLRAPLLPDYTERLAGARASVLSEPIEAAAARRSSRD